MNTLRTAYEVSPSTIGPLLLVVGAMLAVALGWLVVRCVSVRALPVAVAVVALTVLAATPADAASRYYPNGCERGSTVGRTQLVYLHSIPTPRGRICRYEMFRKIPLLGWWPMPGTVSKWAR